VAILGKEELAEGKRSKDWYVPQPYNRGKQIVRVSIIPSAQLSSTLFITLSNPPIEEYIVKNQTDETVHLFKYFKSSGKPGKEVEAVLQPRGEACIVWDAPDVSPKCLTVYCGGAHHWVNLEELDNKKKEKL